MGFVKVLLRCNQHQQVVLGIPDLYPDYLEDLDYHSNGEVAMVQKVPISYRVPTFTTEQIGQTHPTYHLLVSIGSSKSIFFGFSSSRMFDDKSFYWDRSRGCLI